MAARTRNSYLQAIRGLCNWCVETGRLTVNPLATIAKADEKADRRRQRRALTEDELRRLLDVARRRPLLEAMTMRRGKNKGKPVAKVRPETRRRLEALGRERALIYKTLVLTGLRKGELASLSVGQLTLDTEPTYLQLKAADEKNREGSSIPIRADLAADLRAWLDAKAKQTQEEANSRPTVRLDDAGRGQNSGQPSLPPDTLVFSVPRDLVKILDRDLRQAGIPKTDERGRTVDVHALRHTFGTHLSKGGVSPRTAQAAMRHSKIDLTMNVYTDPKLLDVAGALETLPSLPLVGETEMEQVAASATGTDDLTASRFAPKFAPTAGKRCKSLASVVKMTAEGKASTLAATIAVNACGVKQKRPLTFAVNDPFKRGRRDSNPQPPDRQSGTLTN